MTPRRNARDQSEALSRKDDRSREASPDRFD